MAAQREYDVLVIGGGQAGLAMGYHLQRRGVPFTIVDAGSEIGHVWRSRWDSLRLFTPAQYANLPGMQFPAPKDTYATRDQVADYLADYASHSALQVQSQTQITQLTKISTGFAAVSAGGQTLTARSVVVATGPFSKPYIPSITDELPADVVQLHTSQYRNPGQVPSGRVLVVGGGNSGFQIAAELADAGRQVELSEGRRNACVPQRLAGKDIFWWQHQLGLLRVTADSRLGRLMAANDGIVIGSSRQDLRSRGVTLRPRTTAVNGSEVLYANGSSSTVDAVIWATGFRLDDSWIRIPGALDINGRLLQRRGTVKNVNALYTLGRAWQHTTGSALLGFVQHDAAWLAEQITARTASQKV
ncbi:FAD-dependent oxidoreductase [Kribbella sp. NPDC006257]|uniref:flavin-containing monooxygenase n=1 Tax=Kribbella sp. NPDC006257 TaxID=3156738 RepID=UPI00339EF106